MLSAPTRSVGLDGLNLAIPRGTGVATYTRSLGWCAAALGYRVDTIYGLNIDPAADSAMREVMFFELMQTERERKPPPYPSFAWVADQWRAHRGLSAVDIPLGRVVPMPRAAQLGRHGRILNVQDLFGRARRYFRNFGRFVHVRVPDPPAIMHWTYPVPVLLEGARNLYTVHDVVPLRLPYATLDNKPYHRKLLAGCLRWGDRIVTVSETSKRDILDFFPDADPARIVNTYQAVPPPAPEVADAGAVVAAFGLKPGGYFLFCGSIEPKKNVGRLLQAHLMAAPPLPLVIVGARSWGADEELTLLKHRPKDDRAIRQIEYLPQDVLATLVRHARAVVFPSLYEGFGLPVLEAMQLGTPVVTSTGGSLPEVAGDAAVLVDPYDIAALGEALRRVATDDALCADLRARGPRQAARFGMDVYQARVGALYDEVLRT